jgi:hypothetical protein
MKQVVSFSGGRTSAYLVWLMKDKADFVFMDTGAEHPKTYEFIRDIVKHWNIKLTCLQGDFNQPLGEGHSYNVVLVDDLKHNPVNGVYGQMMRKYGVPTISSAWCTNRMKEETFNKYCNGTYGKGNYVTWLGMRIDEPKRLHIGKNQRLRYLAEISDFEKSDILQWWKKQPFDLQIDEHLGNCVFCFKKMSAKVALAERDEPELFKEWLRAIDSASGRLNEPVWIDDIFGSYKREISKGVMYRKHQTAQDVIAQFRLFEYDELKAHVYRNLKDSGTCSESCEPDFQQDLFEDNES